MTSERRRPLVVDASVGVAICIEEPAVDPALSILRERDAHGGKLLVPAFFWLEVVNVLVRRYRQPPGLVVASIVDLQNLNLETVELDRPQLLLTIDAMGRGALSAYDAAYLALAESADAELLTFDRRLAVAAGDRAIPMDGGHTIWEARESYAPSWAGWPGAAAYLKKLRAQVAGQATG
ncbi:MAG TPA: type II toxin-antitoxin system VapC family toxin [Candidatus Limnocylindria bacterium]